MKTLHLCDNTDLGRIAAECHRLGCGIEVQSFYDPAYAESHADAIGKHREAIAGISSRALHGPFGDLSAGSFDSEIRRVTRMRYEQAVTTARALDIPRIILHHGYVPGTSHPSGWLKRITQFWKESLSDLSVSMQFHLENHLEHDPQLMADVVDSINDSRLNICLDIGHAHCLGRIPVAEWPRRLGARIGYVHLHDNHGESDEHLALGEGTIDLPEVLAALEDHSPGAIWALEATRAEQIIRSIDWLVDHGFEHGLSANPA